MACDQLPALLAPPMRPAEAAHGAGLHCAPAPLDAPPDEAVEGCLFAHTLRTTRGPGFGFGGPSDILLAASSRERGVKRRTLPACALAVRFDFSRLSKCFLT